MAMSLLGLFQCLCLYLAAGVVRMIWTIWRLKTENVVIWYARLKWMPKTTDAMGEWTELLFLTAIWPLWLGAEEMDDGEN